jgi:hypothetical protein
MKATLPDGTQFEGTADEFLIIRGHSAGNGHKTVPILADVVWNEKRARKLWDSIDVRHGGGNQKKLLSFLISNGGHATEDEVRKQLNIKKGQQLAGILANLSRNARREAKDEDVKVVVREYNAKHMRVYRIPDDVLQFFKQF